MTAASAPESLRIRNQAMLALLASAQPAQIVKGNLEKLRRLYLTPEVIGMVNLWLARFRFGPMEWLWHSLTYGYMQLMRSPAQDHIPAAVGVH